MIASRAKRELTARVAARVEDRARSLREAGRIEDAGWAFMDAADYYNRVEDTYSADLCRSEAERCGVVDREGVPVA